MTLIIGLSVCTHAHTGAGTAKRNYIYGTIPLPIIYHSFPFMQPHELTQPSTTTTTITITIIGETDATTAAAIAANSMATTTATTSTAATRM